MLSKSFKIFIINSILLSLSVGSTGIKPQIDSRLGYETYPKLVLASVFICSAISVIGFIIGILEAPKENIKFKKLGLIGNSIIIVLLLTLIIVSIVVIYSKRQ